MILVCRIHFGTTELKVVAKGFGRLLRWRRNHRRHELRTLVGLDAILSRFPFSVQFRTFRSSNRRLTVIPVGFSLATGLANFHTWRVWTLECGRELRLAGRTRSLQRLISSGHSQIRLEGALFLLFFVFTFQRIPVLACHVLIVICLLKQSFLILCFVLDHS